jgi:protein involved in polysaccharide export with SLBB domain
MKTIAFLLITTSLLPGCTPSPQRGGRFSELPTAPNVQAQSPTDSSKPVDPQVPVGQVRISYEVLHPGDYPYRDGMKVEDLVNTAGGLSDFASGIRVVRGGTNLVKAYYGSLRRTRESKHMETTLEPGDQVWISRRYY